MLTGVKMDKFPSIKEMFTNDIFTPISYWSYESYDMSRVKSDHEKGPCTTVPPTTTTPTTTTTPKSCVDVCFDDLMICMDECNGEHCQSACTRVHYDCISKC